jgi:hypothetical protein
MNKGTTLVDFYRKRGVVRELSPGVIRKVIQGYRDEISPAAAADDAFYRQFRCPSCRSDMTREFLGGSHAVGTTWVDGCTTPQALLRCIQCKLLMNPRSGLIIEQGTFVPTIPIDDDIIGRRR